MKRKKKDIFNLNLSKSDILVSEFISYYLANSLTLHEYEFVNVLTDVAGHRMK